MSDTLERDRPDGSTTLRFHVDAGADSAQADAESPAAVSYAVRARVELSPEVAEIPELDRQG